MFEKWGSVDGDTNADGIIADRRLAKKVSAVLRGVTFWVFIASAFWYGSDGGPGTLAFLIVMAVLALTGVLATDLHETHTFVMIAERRVQLLEQQMAGLRQDVRDLLPRRSYGSPEA